MPSSSGANSHGQEPDIKSQCAPDFHTAPKTNESPAVILGNDTLWTTARNLRNTARADVKIDFAIGEFLRAKPGICQSAGSERPGLDSGGRKYSTPVRRIESGSRCRVTRQNNTGKRNRVRTCPPPARDRRHSSHPRFTPDSSAGIPEFPRVQSSSSRLPMLITSSIE